MRHVLTTIPGDGLRNNLVHLYKIMNAEISIGKKNMIIKLTTALIEREFYDMHHILPVPFFTINAWRMINTKTQYICNNKHQDKYYMISQNEKAACKTFMDDILICEQKHILYNMYNGSSDCEMAIFSQAFKAIPPKCETIPIDNGQI